MPHLHLITAEDPLTLQARSRELIRFPQLTMPLLAALTPRHWEVSHCDEIVARVDSGRACDLVGISAATPGAPHAYELAAAFRARSIPVVMGGPHATLRPLEVAQHVDLVVMGEAEPLWHDVLHDWQERPRRKLGRHTLNPTVQSWVEELPNGSRIFGCPVPATLDQLPQARRDLIHHGGFNRWWATRGAIIATRGCPHRCDYCTIPKLYPRAQQMRLRPVAEVIAEVRSFSDKGVVFWDDNIGAVPAYAKELFRQLRPLKRWWTSQTTLNSLRDSEFLELAAASGCKALFVGLESINQASLNAVHKGHNRVQDYRSLLSRCHSLGVAIQAGLIFGFEEDDTDVFARTVDTFAQLGLDNATISLLVPYPGTPAYDDLEKDGRIIDHDWRHYNGKTHVVYRPRRMTPDQLLNGYEWAKTQFYSLSGIFQRLNRSRTGLWWNLPRNLGYHLGLVGEVRARAAMHTQGLALSQQAP
ncbi:B12-binding domain-containing radical SAM protein [bacterium]|nr:B12-binding domain-containing radical SAM protein [bacterium]